MEKEDYRRLDEAIYYVYHWYAKLGESTNTLKLVGFNKEDKSHLTLLQVGAMVKKIYSYDLRINCKFLDYLRLQKKYHNLVEFKRCKGDKNYPSCNTVVTIIEQRFYKNILEDAYEEYYKR